MIDIRFGFLFPLHIRLFAGAMVIFSIAVPWLLVGIGIFFACAFVVASWEGTEIDVAKNRYREYTSYMFIKTGKFEPLLSVEKIFITRGIESFKANSPHGIHTMVIDQAAYNGYLKFSTGEKIQLLRVSDKEKLIERLKPLSAALHVDIVDHSLFKA